jgi:hypothetical protein
MMAMTIRSSMRLNAVRFWQHALPRTVASFLFMADRATISCLGHDVDAARAIPPNDRPHWRGAGGVRIVN